uniref:Uncharacterized protein n=1 Tax=viral metagenome TaxID=1070528 RepID=A0A6M3JFZ1_9ZZZZ
MVRYECPECGHRWRGRGRVPGGEVHCPRCGTVAYTYVKAKVPMREGTGGT